MWTTRDSVELYGIDRWGAGYFDVNTQGHLTVSPAAGDPRSVDLKVIVDELVKQRGLSLPIILRFPQILEDRVKGLNTAFEKAIAEFQYGGKYMGVFPLKVNQRREVVEELLRAGRKYNYGLEVGSKAEFITALAMDPNPSSLLICNGFKDDTIIKMATHSALMGKRVFLVVEEINELHHIIERTKKSRVKPLLGIRAKLYSRGSGKWAESGGEGAKFGLTTTEMLECIGTMRELGYLDQFKMLHFHIGSQITEIRRVQDAVKEAARVYSKVRHMHIDIDYLNIGGGLGVDYDGSKTSSESSANYDIQEYANNVVYTVKSVCEEEQVEPPNIVTESGRAVAAFHSMLIANITGSLPSRPEKNQFQLKEDDPQVVRELYDTWRGLTIKNYAEYYHDALHDREDLVTLFNLGQIELEDRSLGELLFWDICRKALKYALENEDSSEEFEELRHRLAEKYVMDFSVFQSMPDFWAVKQLFPVVPIHRLEEEPGNLATLADITCDSDGEINRFVDLKDIKEVLEVHELRVKKGRWAVTGDTDPYYISVLLLGAYQDTIGDYHNLLGEVNEALVIMDPENRWHIKNIVQGDTISEVLRVVKYDPDELATRLKHRVDELLREGKLDAKEAERIVSEYRKDINGYTYLTGV